MTSNFRARWGGLPCLSVVANRDPRAAESLGSIDAGSSKTIYEAVKRIDWREHLEQGATLACDCSGGNESIRHTIYGSQLLKDAVCDNLRDATGERPNIKPERPDVLLHLHVEGPTALLSVDFSGESLHRRGYRSEGGRAPLKENVAAAVLLRAGWPGVFDAGGLLLDPMCCSGTFSRKRPRSRRMPRRRDRIIRLPGWHSHDAACGNGCAPGRANGAARAPRARRCIWARTPMDAVRMAIANAEQAGLPDWLHVEKRSQANWSPRADTG